uniref:Nuclease HARBI1 n=1 Tax=Cacopsylla melanoneura TaxID=428564 RepID=A0A8D8TFT5_9HEMI
MEFFPLLLDALIDDGGENCVVPAVNTINSILILNRQNEGRRIRQNMMPYYLRTHNRHVRPINYSEVWVSRYLDADFYSLFRMNRACFFVLLTLLIHDGAFRIQWSHGREPVTPEKMLQISLRYFSFKGGIIEIADQFNVSVSTVFIVRNRTMKALKKILPSVIKWPQGDDLKIIEQEFKLLGGFPGVIGAIDGSHISIRVPRNEADSYTNRKMGHSIILQAVCTSKKLFIDIDIGKPGRIHDARVLSLSKLSQYIETRNIIIEDDHHILGDSAYPLKPWLLVPYKDFGHLTRQQRNYNYLHSKTRVVIENAFGLLKNRWQKCQKITTKDPKTAWDIVAACCVLHNFCLIQQDYFQCDQPVAVQATVAVPVDDEAAPILATNKRDQIAAALEI